MEKQRAKNQTGFSLIELAVAMVIMLTLLGIVSTVMSRTLGIRSRESRRTDALTSAQAAMNVISREVANTGFGIYDGDASTLMSGNGIVLADSNANRIHVRSNYLNTGPRTPPAGSTVISTNQPGEDVTYFYDDGTDSIVRYDPHGIETSPGVYGPQTSVVVSRISNVVFEYYNYSGANSTPTVTSVPTADTSRIRITVAVNMDPVVGQPDNQQVRFSTDVTLRNANYMLRQY
jgi:prepilin-type N-terminal cleavage/methylation domain-containing protein